MGRRNKKNAGKSAPVPQTTHVMKFDINVHDKFKDKLAVFQTGNYNWTAHIYRGNIFYEEYAVFDLFCHCSLSHWGYEGEAELIVGKKSTYKMEHYFELKRNCISCPTLIKWADLINPDNGYVKDNKISLEIRMTKVSRKVQRNAVVVIKDYPGIRNLEIHVGKSKFRLNKQLLAYTSAFFDEEMEAGKFKDDEPYILGEIEPGDFRLYLDLVYHPKQYFSAYHAKDMLEIASRFRNTEIVATCQNVILEDLKENKLSSKDKAKLAEVYDLDTVKELFRPEALLPPSSTPRFMAVEPRKVPDLKKIEAIRELVTDTLVHHFEDCPRHKCGHCPDEEEEDIDQSVPSTSGCTY